MSLAALIHALGQGAGDITSAYAGGEEAYHNQAAKNLELWLKRQEAARNEGWLDLQRQRLAMEQARFAEEQRIRQEEERALKEAFAPDVFSRLIPQAGQPATPPARVGSPVVPDRAAETPLVPGRPAAPPFVPLAPPVTQNPLANKILAETYRALGLETAEARLRQQQLNDALARLDPTSPTYAKDVARIYLQHQRPEGARAATDIYQQEQEAAEFQRALPEYRRAADAMRQDPTRAAYVPLLEAAILTGSRKNVQETLEHISRLVDTAEARAATLEERKAAREQRDEEFKERMEHLRLQMKGLEEERDWRRIEAVRGNLHATMRLYENELLKVRTELEKLGPPPKIFRDVNAEARARLTEEAQQLQSQISKLYKEQMRLNSMILRGPGQQVTPKAEPPSKPLPEGVRVRLKSAPGQTP